MSILALEGPSFAGKTTAIRELRAERSSIQAGLCLECYVQGIPKTRDIPPPLTRSTEEQLQAFHAFMKIERERVSLASRRPATLVVLDRSVDTLAAHAYALDHLFGFAAHAEICEQLRALPHLRPDHTVYLDVPSDVLRSRRAASGSSIGEEYFLHDFAFLRFTREYFTQRRDLHVARKITVVEGDVPVEKVVRAVSSVVDQLQGT